MQILKVAAWGALTMLVIGAPARADQWKYLPPPTSCSQIRVPPGRVAHVWREVRNFWWPKTGAAFMEGRWQYECAQVQAGARLAVLMRNFSIIDAHCYVGNGPACSGPPPRFGIGRPVR